MDLREREEKGFVWARVAVAFARRDQAKPQGPRDDVIEHSVERGRGDNGGILNESLEGRQGI